MTAAICPCGAAIVWARSVNGKPQPLDAKPDPKGNIVLDLDTEPPTARVVSKSVLETYRREAAAKGIELELYTAHHGTCPRADEFRKRGENKGKSVTGSGVFGPIPAA